MTAASARQVDVLVVGGGPAGLAAARTAADAGLETLVVERELEIGEPVHTSGATTVAAMREFDVTPSCYHVLDRWRFVSPGASATFDAGEDAICALDVRGTYRHLASLARDAGATVRTGARATEPLLEGGRVAGCRVATGEGELEVRARAVVDASGYRAAVARRAGLHPGFTRFGVGAEVELVAPRYDQGEALLVVGERWAPVGYGWAFPWGEGRVRVGVGVHHGDVRDDPRRLLETLLGDADRLGIDLRGARETERHHGLIPAESMPHALVGDGILCVGDAGAQATLVVGEGIRLGLVAGRLGGATIARALAAGAATAGALRPYEEEFRRRFGRNLAIGYALNRRLATYSDRDWDDRVRLLGTVPSELVTRLLMSEFGGRDLALWLLRRPDMWARAIRFGARGSRLARRRAAAAPG